MQAGPLIIDNDGRVVWFRPLDTHGVTDFRVQRYLGRPVLTWWHGRPDKGGGDSGYTIYDSTYRLVTHVQPGNGMVGDIHEFKITPRNTALMTTSRQIRVKGRRVLEGGLQEVDIKTGRVLFDWRSIDHVRLVESYYHLPRDPGRIFDYFHVNSIEIDHDGNLLVSARNTHTIYKISRRTGKILWRLGGKRSDFTMGRGASFAWQHDARRRPDGRPDPLRQLCRAAGPQAVARSRPPSRHEAHACHGRAHLRPPAADRRRRPGQPAAARQRPLLRRLGSPVALHGIRAARNDPLRRALRPRTRRLLPRLSPSAGPPGPGTGLVVAVSGRWAYVSWNGATDVVQWELVAGPRKSQLRPVRIVAKKGFETRIPPPQRCRVDRGARARPPRPGARTHNRCEPRLSRLCSCA